MRAGASDRRLLKAVAAAGIALTAVAAGGQVPALAGVRRSIQSHLTSGHASPGRTQQPASGAVAAASSSATPTSDPSPVPLSVGMATARSLDALAGQLASLQAGTGAHVGVSLIELGGADPQGWNYHGDDPVAAASTYKLPLLMAEAELVASGQVAAGDQICYLPDDWEDGWFDDYDSGVCYTRAELANRAGHYSDNTAAHMLVRSLGGTAALNAYATAHGAAESAFYDPNTTTASDLARLMADEAMGQAGGAPAQQWLYPLLTHTLVETGIPAGVPAGLTVIHKIGEYQTATNDVALVVGGSNGPYVLAVCIDGPGGDAGMSLVAQVSSLVWQLESNR